MTQFPRFVLVDNVSGKIAGDSNDIMRHYDDDMKMAILCALCDRANGKEPSIYQMHGGMKISSSLSGYRIYEVRDNTIHRFVSEEHVAENSYLPRYVKRFT